jgi:hypothetical protein
MHPFVIADDVKAYGFWYAYWHLRDNWKLSRTESLWLLWVARQYVLHRDGRTMIERFADNYL